MKTLTITKEPDHFAIRHKKHGSWSETFNSKAEAVNFAIDSGYSQEEIGFYDSANSI